MEATLPKYEEAWYLNEADEWELVSYRELGRDDRRAELRERDLRDERQGAIELGIRNHPKTPHFFAKRRIRTDLDPGAKESLAHSERQRMVCSFLSKYEKHNFGYYERPWDRQDKGFESLLKVKNYKWSPEVPFGLV